MPIGQTNSFGKVTSWPHAASADIRVFGRTSLPVYSVASDWPHTFFTPKVFLFSIVIYSYSAWELE